MTVAARRQKPLIVIATTTLGGASAEAERLRQAGCVVYEVRGLDGCLRAAALQPDAMLLDRSLPARAERLLRAYPAAAATRISWLSDVVTLPTARVEALLQSAA